MSVSYLTQFPMENITLNIIPLVWFALCVVEFLFIQVLEFFSILVPNRVERLQDCHSRCENFDDSEARVAIKNPDFELPCSSENKEEETGGLTSRGDAEEVMERLGIFCPSEDGRLEERLDPDELSKLFEEKEPSLDEVKGAFDVFDENSDGFIDSKELQRVLSVLGFKEGGEMENCRRMIGLFDENGDGRIDFGEFVKIMENSFC